MSFCINIKLDKLSEIISSDYDIFICSSSFEGRCLTIPLILKNNFFEKIIICHYENNYINANKNFHQLKEIFENSTTIYFKKNIPIQNLDNIVEELYKYKTSIKRKSIKVLIDISTFTHEMVLILIYLFKEYLAEENYQVKLVYNSAIDYSFNEKDENKWLSKGVGEIRTVLGFSGQILPFKRTLLIILVGFEAERVKSIIEIFEPNKVMLGYASEEGAINKRLQLKNKNIFDQVKNTLTIDVESFEFSCKTPDETAMLLQQLINKFSTHYNIVISGLNNKISTIGCALAAIKNPQVQICYAPALTYNIDSYSKASENAFIIEF